MAWTAGHRRAADRRGLRYPSDLTDAEWALVAPLIRPAKHGGRPRKVDVREVLNAVFYVLSTGCQWSALPKDLPPKSTVWDYFSRWEWEGSRWRALAADGAVPMHGALGGDRRSHVVEAAAETILEVFHARRDMALAELRAELAERGLRFGYGTLWRFFDRRGCTRKKRPRTRPSSSARTS